MDIILKKSEIELAIASDIAIKGDLIIQNGNLIRSTYDSSWTHAYHLYFYIGNSIIASTDRDLNVPRPSSQFLEKYVEEYNKKQQITKVLIEFESVTNPDIIKTKNNIITIKRLKNSWNKSELKKELKKAMFVYAFSSTSQRSYSIEEFDIEFEEWFNKMY